jgi:hypothetical protein
MRPSEVWELRRGCIKQVKDDEGHVSYRLHSRVIKRREHGGEPESWRVIRIVADAVSVLEQLAPANVEQLLFTEASVYPRVNRRRKTGREAPEKEIKADLIDFSRQLDRFISWQNSTHASTGLPVIPPVRGQTWHLVPTQFRRTLARQLAFRPHGTIASKIHLKHIHATVTEGYWGPHGESAQAFLAEVEREEREARHELMRKRYEEFTRGEPMTGGATKRLVDDFAAIKEDVEAFQGTVDQRDKRLNELLRRRSNTLHIGILNDCHFVDPSQARCLQKQGVTDAKAPIIPACEPSRCANALITRDHIKNWQRPIEQIDTLLEDYRIPQNERTRLAAEKRRLETVIAPLVEETQ